MDSDQEEEDGNDVAEVEDRESLDQVIDNENMGWLFPSQSPEDQIEYHEDQFRQGSSESAITANLGLEFGVADYFISPVAGPSQRPRPYNGPLRAGPLGGVVEASGGWVALLSTAGAGCISQPLFWTGYDKFLKQVRGFSGAGRGGEKPSPDRPDPIPRNKKQKSE